MEMDTLQKLMPQGFPVSFQVLPATFILGALILAYSFISTKDRPIAGFPIVTLDGLSPKKAWMLSGQETLVEGTRKVRVFCANAMLYLHHANQVAVRSFLDPFK